MHRPLSTVWLFIQFIRFGVIWRGSIFISSFVSLHHHQHHHHHDRLLSMAFFNGLANFTNAGGQFKWKWAFIGQHFYPLICIKKDWNFFRWIFIIICYISFCVHENGMWTNVGNGLWMDYACAHLFAYHLNGSNESTELHRNVIISVHLYDRCCHFAVIELQGE